MSKPKVLVMMPVFNGERLVKRALDGALTQSYDEVYPVLYNDGSTDDTAKIVRAMNSSKITFIDEPVNKGLPEADRAIRRAILEGPIDGEYIAWVAADDWWRTDKIERQMDLMIREPDVDVCYTDTVFLIEANGQATTIKAPEFDYNRLCANNFINGSSVLFKRSVLETVDWDPDLKNCEDWDYWLRAYKDGFKFMRLPEVLTANLRHGENISRNRALEAYYHSKVCIKHGLPIEIAAARMLMYKDPRMIKGIVRAWCEEAQKRGSDT
jgi:glycosyltransferase involved in cell wall biosynthesis